MPEQMLPLDLSFDRALKRINYLLFIFKQYCKSYEKLKSDSEKLEFLTNILYDDKLFHSPSSTSSPFYTTRPQSLFKQTTAHIFPLIGHKDTKNLKNDGLVIGMKTNQISYRVDYDVNKGLHFNLDIGSDSFCIRPKEESTRYRMAKPSQDNASVNKGKEAKETIKPRKKSAKSIEKDGAKEGSAANKITDGSLIQYKFWMKMTLSYYAIVKKDNQSKFPLEEIFHEGFESMQKELLNQKTSPDVQTAIEKCATMSELSSVAHGNKKLRDYLIEKAVFKLTSIPYAQDHFSDEVLTDSETYSDVASIASVASDHKKKVRIKR